MDFDLGLGVKIIFEDVRIALDGSGGGTGIVVIVSSPTSKRLGLNCRNDRR